MEIVLGVKILKHHKSSSVLNVAMFIRFEMQIIILFNNTKIYFF